MNILALVGSYRKHQTIDQLVDAALAGATAGRTGDTVEKVHLAGLRIAYCRNCAACKKVDPAQPIADCVIHDDMDDLLPKLVAADALILGTPINLGTATAVMKTFLERACWTLAKPGHRPIEGCPEPRTIKPRRAIILVSAGTVPPWLRWFCDDATSLLKSFCDSILGAKVVGSLYAGAVEKRGIASYQAKAFALGRRLTPAS
jgi:FMN-dependent NADH-azoreductase